VSVTKTEVYTILRDVCIVSNRLIYLHKLDSKLSEMETLAQPLCESVFTPTTFRHSKRLPIRISNPSHKKFHFKKYVFQFAILQFYLNPKNVYSTSHYLQNIVKFVIMRVFKAGIYSPNLS
jgi:hypothetical protein